MKKLIFLYLLLFIIVSVGCKTVRNTIEIKDQVEFSLIPANEINFQENNLGWFDGKFNAEIIADGKGNKIKGRVRIRKDSLIWVSIKPDVAIIEVFRVLITPDSVFLIDYLNKKFFKDRFSALKEFIKYDVSFNMVQNIFVGNPTFIMNINDYKVFTNKADENILASSDFKTYLDARKAKQDARFLFQAIWNKNNLHTRNLVYDPANKIELDLQYVAFEMVDSVLLPKTGQVTVIGDSTNTRFDFTYTKIVLNTPFEFPFTIPENYEELFLKK